MTKNEIEALVDRLSQDIPERMSGNEQNAILARRLGDVAATDRKALVEMLRDWFSLRVLKTPEDSDYGKKVGQLFLALEIVRRYRIGELQPEILSLIKDTRTGKTYLPYYAEMIEKYLADLNAAG